MVYQKSSMVISYTNRGTALSFRVVHQRGSVTPFVAMLVIMMLGTLGVSLDLMRDFETYHQLEFAAQSAALYGLSLATNADGSYTQASARDNIAAAVIAAGNANWNSAQSGPTEGLWSKPVTFTAADIVFVNNVNDANELFLQVTARRDGSDAIAQFFWPLLFTQLSGNEIPPDLRTFRTSKVVEVLGQSASRIGAGAPLDTPQTTRAVDLVGFASLPLAISNAQFATIASPSRTNAQYTIDLISSTQGSIRGCFVNLIGSGSGDNYYGSATGDLAVDQLEGLLNYFAAGTRQLTLAPAMVERGSQLNAFDPNDASFFARRNEVAQALRQLPGRDYILPVLAGDPSFITRNTVVGFARFRLGQVTIINNMPTAVTVFIAESVPVRNASSVTGFSSIPGNAGNLMPPPVYPFVPRPLDLSSNGVAQRPRGIALGPAISPRSLQIVNTSKVN